MYKRLFLYVEIVLAGIIRAGGCREEGRCLGSFKPQRDECKDLQVLLCSVKMVQVCRLRSHLTLYESFVLEASCPHSGLDLVRARHVFQSDQ